MAVHGRSLRTLTLAGVFLLLALLGVAVGSSAQDPPGTCPNAPRLAPVEEEAVVQAAEVALESYRSPGIRDWSVVSVQGAGEWAVVTIAPVTTAGPVAGDGDILLARREGDAWRVVLPTSEVFREWLALVPPDLLVPFPERSAFQALAVPQATSTGLYRLPYGCDERAWVSRAGADHDNAIDFIIQSATWGGDPIVAAADGWVYRVMQSRTACCCNSSYSSNWIILRHPNGEYSYYLHLAANSALVKEGDWVRQGEPIAVEGDVGYSCATASGSCKTRTCNVAGDWDYCCEHLHFELRNNGTWSGSRLNPRFEDVSGELVTSQHDYTSGNCPGCDDGEAPAAEFGDDTPQAGAYFGDSVSVAGWAADDGECISGVETVDVRALFDGEWNGAWCGEWCTVARLAPDGGEEGPVAFDTTWDLRDVPAGEILLGLEVTDHAGNHSLNASGVRPIYRMDGSPPHLALSAANGRAVLTQGQILRSNELQWSFSGTASDAEGLDRIALYAQGAPDALGTIPGVESWTYPPSGSIDLPGDTTAVFRAYDTQGQRNPPGDRDTVRLLVDAAPPRTLFDLEGTAGENGWYRSDVTVHLAAHDRGTGQGQAAWASGLQSLHYQVDGGAWQEQLTATRTLAVTGESGDHAVGCYAVDHLGNQEAIREIPVPIDATLPAAPGPITELHGVPSGEWQQAVSRPAFAWEPADDATSGVWYYVVSWGDALVLTTTPAFDPPPAATGIYTLAARAVDRAGNQGPATGPYIFYYDGTPPHAPEIEHRAGVLSGVCQNQVRTADFAWPTPRDGGSGIAGYHLYWGPDPDGDPGTLTTTQTYSNPVPICTEGSAATYYLRAGAEDQVGWESEAVAFALVYDGSPPTATLTANGGLEATNSVTVALAIATTDEGCGAAQMRLSNDGQDWTAWQALVPQAPWQIPGEPAQWHTIYLQVMDRAGNVSEVVSDSVYLEPGDSVQDPGGPAAIAVSAAAAGLPSADSEPTCPFYRLAIDADAPYTTQPTVTLSLCGPDPVEMLIGSDPDLAQATWQPFSATQSWRLDRDDEPGAGERWIYARFRDSAGAVHGTFADDIVFDPAPPAGQAAFRLSSLLPETARSGAHGSPLPAAPGGTALLTVGAADEGSGLEAMQVSLLPDLEGVAWQPFSATIPFAFAEDGIYTAHVRLRDGAGNFSPVLSDSIVVDTLPPTGSARVAGGTVGPRAISATLELSGADETSGVSQVRVGADPSLADAGWQPYAPQVTVPISPAGALSGILYVQFRDGSGNRSAVVPAPYEVDGTPPYGWVEYLASGPLNIGVFGLHVEDDQSAVSETWISADYWFLDGVERLPFQEQLTWQFTTGPYVFARFADTAGNLSRPYLLLRPGYGIRPFLQYLPLVLRAN